MHLHVSVPIGVVHARMSLACSFTNMHIPTPAEKPQISWLQTYEDTSSSSVIISFLKLFLKYRQHGPFITLEPREFGIPWPRYAC